MITLSITFGAGEHERELEEALNSISMDYILDLIRDEVSERADLAGSLSLEDWSIGEDGRLPRKGKLQMAHVSAGDLLPSRKRFIDDDRQIVIKPGGAYVRIARSEDELPDVLVLEDEDGQ